MARRTEEGIVYFPMNTDIESNPKIKLLMAEHRPDAFFILIRLYLKIYREKGYWLDWYKRDTRILFADDTKNELNRIETVVSSCIERNIFHTEIYEKYGILTNDRIQINFLEAKSRQKSINFIREFKVFSEHDYKFRDNVNIIDLNVDILSKKEYASTQNKIKEKKTEYIKDIDESISYQSGLKNPPDGVDKENLQEPLQTPSDPLKPLEARSSPFSGTEPRSKTKEQPFVGNGVEVGNGQPPKPAKPKKEKLPNPETKCFREFSKIYQDWITEDLKIKIRPWGDAEYGIAKKFVNLYRVFAIEELKNDPQILVEITEEILTEKVCELWKCFLKTDFVKITDKYLSKPDIKNIYSSFTNIQSHLKQLENGTTQQSLNKNNGAYSGGRVNKALQRYEALSALSKRIHGGS